MSVKEMAVASRVEEEKFRELVEVLVDSINWDLDKLQAALDHNLTSLAVAHAHSIKGTAFNFGLEEMSEGARKMEMFARRGILDGGQQTVNSLREILAEVDAATKQAFTAEHAAP